jgi:hypothetical protein
MLHAFNKIASMLVCTQVASHVPAPANGPGIKTHLCC